MRLAGLLLGAVLLASPLTASFAQETATPQPSIALHGAPKYPADFPHFNYVNPDAPKGGTLRLFSLGSFDSLNPFIVKGLPASDFSDLVYESLMQNSSDEPFSMYGVLAESISVPEDRSWAEFKIRKEAKWADGKPVTADDVVWSFETLTTKGAPQYKIYWADVEKAVAIDEKTVRFTFKVKENAELPLIIAQISVLPKHFWTSEGRNFEKTSLDVPLGSGPYKVGKITAGSSLEIVYDENWWGKDLPINKGRYNFSRIVWDYYRDENVAHEAFVGGAFDAKAENVAKIWQTGYNVPALKDGTLKQELIDNAVPAGMQAFVYNTRRPIFADKTVRQALANALDFEWSNKQFAYGDYIRNNSYFENSELAASGLPSPEELKILEPLRGKIPDEVFTTEYNPPRTDGTGNMRENTRAAIKLLESAGYNKLDEDGIRYKETESGKQRLEFEIMYYSPVFERWVLPFIQNLKRVGAKANFRIVDVAQFQNRLNVFDYDMTILTVPQSESPGNEQREYWGSEKADTPGSRNYMGVKDPVIDELVTGIIHAKSREDLVTRTRALDRVLLWNHYVIPMWHYPKWRLAYWTNKVKRPDTLSGKSPLIATTWWAVEGAQ